MKYYKLYLCVYVCTCLFLFYTVITKLINYVILLLFMPCYYVIQTYNELKIRVVYVQMYKRKQNLKILVY